MKKLNYFFGLLFLIAAFISCDKRDVDLRELPVYSENGSLAIVNLGGNTTCEEVAADKDMTFAFSSGKADYVNGEFVFENSSIGWPEGLLVTVTEGKYVEFTYTSDQYCVGAVIVKGGNASNVYTYNPGVSTDAGLVSPVNASGGPAGLSNLTFCFVECPPTPELKYIAVKAFFWYENGSSDYTLSEALSTGLYPINIGQWCDDFGINPLQESIVPLTASVGNIKIEKGANEWIITIDLNDNLVLDRSYLYVGSLTGFSTYTPEDDCGCPAYYTWPNSRDEDVNYHVYNIPF